MSRRAGWCVPVLLLVALATPLRAQERDLERILRQLAASWARGDAAGLVAHASRDGISIDLREGPQGPLPPRQAAAVLRRYFDETQTVSARTGQAEVTGGSPLRGYGEIAWVVRNRGSTMPERARVFIALVREDGTWKVTQIRLMP
jgi:SnoaL-like domain